MKILNKKNLSFLLVLGLAFSIMTSQTHFVYAAKQENSKAANKTLNIKNESLMELKKKEKALIKKMKAVKNNAVKKKLKQDLIGIQQQIQTLIKTNSSITNTITPDSTGTLPQPISTTNPPKINTSNQPNVNAINRFCPSGAVSNPNPVCPDSHPYPYYSNGADCCFNCQPNFYTIFVNPDPTMLCPAGAPNPYYPTHNGCCFRCPPYTVVNPDATMSCPSNTPYSYYGGYYGDGFSGCCYRCPLGAVANPTPEMSCPPENPIPLYPINNYSPSYPNNMDYNDCCFSCPPGSTPNPDRGGNIHITDFVIGGSNTRGFCPFGTFPTDATNKCCFTCPEPYTPNPQTLPATCPANSFPLDATNNFCCYRCGGGSTPNPNRLNPPPNNACPAGTTPYDMTNNCCFNVNCNSYLVTNTDGTADDYSDRCMTKTISYPETTVYQLMCADPGKYCTAWGPVNSDSTCACLNQCGNMVVDAGEVCDPLGSMCDSNDPNKLCGNNCMSCNDCISGSSPCGVGGMCCMDGQCAGGTCCPDDDKIKCGNVCCNANSCKNLYNPDDTGTQVCCNPAAGQALCGTGASAKCCANNTMCLNNNCCPNICGTTCCQPNETCDMSTLMCVIGGMACGNIPAVELCGGGACPDGRICMADLTVGAESECVCVMAVGCGNMITEGPTVGIAIAGLAAITTTGEECDDGNLVDGDGCSCTCQNEECGDGAINNNGIEECEPPGTAGCGLDCKRELFCPGN